MRSIRMTCPNSNCRTVLSVPEDYSGRRVQCSVCGHAFTLPARPRSRLRRKARVA
ncbi:MAG TPA: hypothetical protein VM389_10650 [Phycisphaerae bacterium]|nr:hypothetical protein [Phycisphaerae bacterium]